MPNEREHLDPVLKLLIGCIVFFTSVLFASELWFKDDSQLFQVMATILTGFTGAFLGRLKPAKGDTGQRGPIGDTGETGDTGAQGMTGARGSVA